jgi:hypothetical protein
MTHCSCNGASLQRQAQQRPVLVDEELEVPQEIHPQQAVDIRPVAEVEHADLEMRDLPLTH